MIVNHKYYIKMLLKTRSFIIYCTKSAGSGGYSEVIPAVTLSRPSGSIFSGIRLYIS